MPNESAELVGRAYGAYVAGDLATMLDYVAPDLEWTYLDPSQEDPEPQVCHGRRELRIALSRLAGQGLRSELEEVVGLDDRVMVVLKTPGIDATRARAADDRNFAVVTVRDGRIAAIRAYRSRREAAMAAGIE